MASPTLPLGSNGGHRKHQQQELQTKNKTAQNSAASTPTRKSPSTTAGAGLDEEADEADSSANEAPSDGDSETDVFALSGAQTSASNGEQRLAGLEGGDMFAESTPQAIGGASASDEDDDYAGVDDVSDDDENEVAPRGGIMRAAEMDLIDEFERTEDRRDANTMTSGMDAMFLQEDITAPGNLELGDGGSADGMFNLDVNMNDDPFVGLGLGDSLYSEMYDDAEKALGIWRQTPEERGRQDSEDSVTSKKRVRFAETHETMSRSSSVSSSDDPNELFPDLFDAQDDPALRQRFGLDVDLDATFQADYSDAGSCYDFDGEEERMALAIDDESDSGEDLSSYDSDTEDGGDTTDEEDDDEPLARASQLAQKRAATSKKAGPSTPTPSTRSAVSTPRAVASPATPTLGRGPKLGKFTIDRTRATMSADAGSKKINLLPPRNPIGKDKAFWERAKTAMTSRNGSPRSSYYNMRTSAGRDMPPRPLTAHSTLGTMFHGNLDILNNEESGFAGNLYPELMPRPHSSFVGSLEEDSEQELDDINMNDFVDLDSDDSDADEPQSASSIMSPQFDLCDSFSSLDPQRNDSLLNHLDQQRGLVGAFRHNQSFAKTFSSLASHPAKRASTSEANALQKGRRAAGNTPMTPARKKRVSQDLSLTGAGIRKAISSPLAGRRPRSRGGSLSGMNQTLGPSLM